MTRTLVALVAAASVVLAAPTAPATLAAPGNSVSGRITNADGAGVGDIDVIACQLVTGSGPSTCPSVARSLEDGSYSMENVPPGTYRIEFYESLGRHPDGYYGAAGFTERYEDAKGVVVAGSDVTGIDIQYPRSFTISGRVTRPDGAPVWGADVFAMQHPRHTFQSVQTGADGTFAIGLTAGSYTLIVAEPENEYVPLYYSTRPDGTPTTIELAADMAGVNFQFAPANHISGLLRVPAAVTSKPLVNVEACQVDGEQSCYYEYAEPDYAEPGAFRVAVPAGRYRLRFIDYDTQTLLPSQWSVAGPVANPGKATIIDATAGDVANVSLTLTPISIGAHQGTSKAGAFPNRALSVRKGTAVTVRLGLGKGFKAAKVKIEVAVAGANGKLGAYRAVATRAVGSDGYAYYTFTASRLTKVRASYAVDWVYGQTFRSTALTIKVK